MNVGELIGILQAKDPSALVVMSSDEEGNNYGMLYAVDAPMLFAQYHGNRSTGEVFEIEEKDDIPNLYRQVVPCIILVPNM